MPVSQHDNDATIDIPQIENEQANNKSMTTGTHHIATHSDGSNVVVEDDQYHHHHSQHHERPSSSAELPAEREEWFTMSDLDITEWIVRFRLGRVLLMLSRWLMKSLGWFLVSFALLAFSLIIMFWFFVMVPMLSGDQSVVKFIVHFAMGVYISAALMFNYIMCIRTDPGKPPEDWKQQALQTGIINALTSPSPVEQQRWSTYCKRCDDPKPPRTHHCHICDRCVMRMDHHWYVNQLCDSVSSQLVPFSMLLRC